ncbi:hypothetical protein NOK12_01320 [Nocardioides sp. OK12]|uniref:sulfatase family protein n=1 Tax=Nocardioides sp. OK12 TaxID=2758661 RepID=UPI0021C3B812|nr:sulfatase [Nocardioides sp. OK12]GHJ57613.1 hypothetical protein NOK12_01320 [Nocardioides sp. OK12]
MGISELPTRVRLGAGVLVVVAAVVLALIVATWPAQTDDGERPQRPRRSERAVPPPAPAERETTAEPGRATYEPKQRQPRPNIVLITTDDQSDAELRFMPRTRRLLGAAGIEFTDAINPHPLCCPARAEILTGEYAHNNGVRHNDGPHGGWSAFVASNEKENLGPWLRRAGYRTAFVGKNLNEYTFAAPRPRGWDFFSPTGERTYSYYGTTFYNDGQPRGFGDKYVADIVRDESVRLIKAWAAEPEPFFLWASHVGPHAAYVDGWRSPVPARRHAGLFGDLQVGTRAKASFNEADVSDKPPFISGRGKLSLVKLTKQVRDRARSLQAIDQANARTIRALRRSGELDDTLVVFVSDNGFLLGEHRYFGKDVPYDEALQVPLLARGPGIEPGTTSRATASMVDLAPTFLDYAGVLDDVRAAGHTDGISLRPVWAEAAPVNDTSLIQAGTSDPEALAAFGWAWRGVRTGRYTYTRWWDGFEEVYDRRRDPGELRNVAGQASYRGVRRELRRRYERLADCSGVRECEQQDFGAVPSPR